MATLTIDVPDACGDALAVCDFLSLDAVAARGLVHEAIHDLAERLEGMAHDVQAIYDANDSTAPEALRAVAIRLEGADVVRRMRGVADALEAVA